MISVLVDHVFVDAVVVVIVVQHAVFGRTAVVIQVFPVRFRFEPEHFHFVGVHGACESVVETRREITNEIAAAFGSQKRQGRREGTENGFFPLYFLRTGLEFEAIAKRFKNRLKKRDGDEKKKK